MCDPNHCAREAAPNIFADPKNGELVNDDMKGWMRESEKFRCRGRVRARFVALVVLLGLAMLLASPAAAERSGRCANGRSAIAAMWLSIAHPGLGEYHLKGWGSWSKMPEKKFWFGFIPFYGWPGYLQVKSAIDSRNCRTNDDLNFEN